ncbi:MAG: hypothetical protein ABR585_07235 [Gemmatimonadaceae bacterium]
MTLAKRLAALNAIDSEMAQPTPLIMSCGCWWENDTRTRACPAHNRPRS